MVKHTLEFTERCTHLNLRHGQLVVCLRDEERTFACEDIGVVVLQEAATSVSTAALNALLESGAAVVICNKRFLPTGMLLPLATHTELVPRMQAQLRADRPALKQAWRQTVIAKIKAQAALLDNPQRKRLEEMQQRVRSGDSDNYEAQAACVYWPSYFPQQYHQGDKRDAEGETLFNACLNYGYSIIRAAVARAIVTAGMVPALGMEHHRRNNPYCLADDLMEPLRPLVDQQVKTILATECDTNATLKRHHRNQLLKLLTSPYRMNGRTGPLLAVLPEYINGYFRFITKEAKTINFPIRST
ncbi:type II CRISPR-associated endonuclease Cas1 [Cerasicoccus frondis]|uniref:type II CRISPR-associated endonuclease Cas1 n=1 Tax=Cerasicoccus frondis TaxID=490090 RepID=UPI0028524EC5|nr:type II CRISPR-associated endonuclease Cas1 [Cerasicoccus frondis]